MPLATVVSIIVLLPLPMSITPFPALFALPVILQAMDETKGDGFGMQKVTKSPPRTNILIVIPTPSLAEIRDGGKFARQDPSVVVTAVHDLQGIRRLLFVGKLDVNVSN